LAVNVFVTGNQVIQTILFLCAIIVMVLELLSFYLDANRPLRPFCKM